MKLITQKRSLPIQYARFVRMAADVASGKFVFEAIPVVESLVDSAVGAHLATDPHTDEGMERRIDFLLSAVWDEDFASQVFADTVKRVTV